MTKRLRFLIVDDTEDMRALTVRMVERVGHVAEEAVDGVAATEALCAHRYDVMLLDLSMPRMSGEDVVRWLHAHPDRAEGMRTVVVTAGRARDAQHCTNSGSRPLCPSHFDDNT